MTKRGQVTTFVVFGLLVVVLALGIYFTRERIFTDILTPKELSVPAQVEDVKNFVEACFDDVLKKAVLLLGSQGGYIEVPGDPLTIGVFANYLPLYGDNKVVYWYYKADNNVEVVQVPTLSAMESEISRYIQDHMNDCLGVFNDFENFKVSKGRMNVITDIKNNKVVSKLEFPFKVTKNEFEFTFDEFYSVYDVPLGDLYTIAQRIYDEENERFFLERKTLDMMSVYDEVPLVGETRDCVAPVWVKEKVKTDLKRILRDNIVHFRIKGTDYVLKSLKNNFFEIEAGIDDKESHVNFLFSELWPIEFQVYPEDNGILRGQSITESLGEVRGIAESFVCLSTYEFLYNIRYPVLLILNKNGYTLQFVIQVVIDRNKPRINTDEFPVFEQYDSRFCNEQTSFSVYTVDPSFVDLNDVDVTYKCINHLCDLGKSRDGLWRGKVPFCGNGFFIGEKRGYHFGKSQVSTSREGAVFLVLEPLKVMNVDVRVMRAGSGELQEGEKVFISLEEENKDFKRFILYPDQKTVELVPGTYTAKISLISPGEFHIEEKSFSTCIEVPKGVFGNLFGITEEECEDITIPGTTVDQLVTGTGEFSFVISEGNLRYSTIIFFVPHHGVIRDVTELSQLVNQTGRLPEFK